MESIIIWHARDEVWSCEGGDVTHPLYESRMHWIPDPTPPPPCRTGMDYSDTPVSSSDTPVQTRDSCMNPRDTQVKSRSAHTKSRTSPVLTSDTQVSAIATSASPGAPLTLPLPRKSRRRRRRKARRSANENSAPHSAAPVTPDEHWANHNSVSQRATHHQPEASDPTQMKSAQCTRVKASTPLIPHSLPFQRPIGIQRFHLGWNAVNFQGFISRAFQTSGRILQLNLIE